jgi:HEAT repeat protein
MACTDITRAELFRCLVDGLTEKESVVRTEAVRGLAELDGDEAALLLRMKARVGDEEPRILGQVFDALWKVEGERAIAFVAPFLEAPADAVREEAALALGASRFAAAVGILRDALDRGRHPQFREVLLRALSLTRQPAALDFLLGLVKTGRMADAEAALDALALHRENQEIRRLAQEAAKGREELRQKFERSFPNEPLVPADR